MEEEKGERDTQNRRRKRWVTMKEECRRKWKKERGRERRKKGKE
jgi:hypothetical protein